MPNISPKDLKANANELLASLEHCKGTVPSMSEDPHFYTMCVLHHLREFVDKYGDVPKETMVKALQNALQN